MIAYCIYHCHKGTGHLSDSLTNSSNSDPQRPEILLIWFQSRYPTTAQHDRRPVESEANPILSWRKTKKQETVW